MLTRLTLDSPGKDRFGLVSQKRALWLQGEVDSEHIELSIHFDVAAVPDKELEESLVTEFVKFACIFRDDFHQLVQQREDVEAFQDTAVEGVL